MNSNNKTAILWTSLVLVALAAIPGASALSTIGSEAYTAVCPSHDGNLGDGTGFNTHESSYCVLNESMTGGQGVGCSTEQWQRGNFGNSMPAAYRGQQACVANYQDNSLCLGYSWHYQNDGGNVEGNKDQYNCQGLA